MKLENILKNTKLKVATIGLAGFLALECLNSCVTISRGEKYTTSTICTNLPNVEIYINGQLTGYISDKPYIICAEKGESKKYKECVGRNVYCQTISHKSHRGRNTILLKKEGYTPLTGTISALNKITLRNLREMIVIDEKSRKRRNWNWVAYLFEF